MKRSEINAAIRWAEDLLKAHHISLPLYAAWSPEDWRAHAGEIDAVKRLMLGWDITDYGCGDFKKIGTVLYTVRNGLQDDPSVGVPYCEKYLLMREGQRLPKHYHVSKTEDIINRAGGVLQLFLWNANPATGEQLETDVVVWQDRIRHVYGAGEEILLNPGNSISLTPYMAHIFGAKPGSGDVICGEVSAVNDDNIDNHFAETSERFMTVEEDVEITVPLVNEYERLLKE